MVRVIKIDNKRILLHKLAWSLRTLDYPVLIADREGNIVERHKAKKHPIKYDLSGNEEFVIHLYASNSGKGYAYIYKIPDEGDAECVDTIVEGDTDFIKRYKGELLDELLHWFGYA
jgi:hypothetical protein